MILIYADGRRTKAVLLARSESQLRVAIPGCDEPLELNDIHGTWVSEDCEPVRVEFAWQGKMPEEVPSEADCICPPELAARLIHLLWSGNEEEGLQADAAMASGGAPGMRAATRARMGN
jgi:hypothetical protein